MSRASSGWRANTRVVIAILFLMAGALQGLAADGQAEASTNPAPTVESRSVTPTEVSSGGGTVTLRAAVVHASTCTFSSTPTVPGLPAKINCTSGSKLTQVTKHVTIPGNSEKKRAYYHFFVAATGTTTVKSSEFNLVEEFSTSGAKPGRPTSVFATPHDGSATVIFNAPSSAGFTPITSYVVTATDETDALNGGESQTAGSSPIVMTGLTDGDTYALDVAATNAAGTGPSSASNGVVPMKGLFGPATTIPGHTGQFVSVSCTGAGDCTAVGGDLVANEVNGIWSSATTLDAPSGASFASVSCTDADDCTAVGATTTAEGAHPVPIYASESDGVWAPAADVSDPSGDAELSGVSCADSADCTAVGYDSAAQEAAYAIESAGVWGPLTDLSENSFLSSVSCLDAGDCTAVGSEPVFNGTPVEVSESGGLWGSVDVIPGPAGYTKGYENSVSCTGPGDCAAVGESTNSSGTSTGASYAVESGGVWSPGALVLSGSATLWTISCTDAGDCTATGAENGNDFYLFESDDVWGQVNIIANSATSRTFLTGVSCTAPAACTSVGWTSRNDTDNPSTPIYAETS